MTTVAGVWSSYLRGQEGLRNSKLVVPSWIHHHISAFRHMAVNTGRAESALLMKMMIASIKCCRRVTLSTECVALGYEIERVRVVAVTTCHTVLVHQTLHERSKHIDFVSDLAIGKIQ